MGDQPMNREQRRAATRRARRMAAVGSAGVLVASGVSLVSGTLTNSASAATTITVTNLNGTGANSLYDAIKNAVSGDTIDFQSGLAGTITLTKNLPTITQDISIVGPGPGVITIDGQNKYHPFEFEHSGAASISGLTITRGYTSYGGGHPTNGDYSGGAIALYRNGGDLTVSNMVITANLAYNDGGGIWCEDGGALLVQDSTISHNVADANHGGEGGGGGMYANDCDSLTIVNSTIADNSSSDAGGGIYLRSTKMDMRNTTVSGNSTHDKGENGGGLQIDAYYLHQIANSTISGNTTPAGEGGAVYFAEGGANIVQSTLTLNTGTTVGGIQTGNAGTLSKAADKTHEKGKPEGGDAAGKASAKRAARSHVHAAGAYNNVNLLGTIVSGDAGLDLKGTGGHGQISSQNSLIGTVDPATVVHDLGGTLLGVNPMLGPLANNGGPTQTHALLAGSPAINTGPNPVPTFTGNQFDQRGPGFVRVIGGRVDIGAFEAPLVARFTG